MEPEDTAPEFDPFAEETPKPEKTRRGAAGWLAVLALLPVAAVLLVRPGPWLRFGAVTWAVLLLGALPAGLLELRPSSPPGSATGPSPACGISCAAPTRRAGPSSG